MEETVALIDKLLEEHKIIFQSIIQDQLPGAKKLGYEIGIVFSDFLICWRKADSAH